MYCISEKQELLDLNDQLTSKDLPANVRRRHMYRNMILMLEDAPMGKGNRKENPECVVKLIQDIAPSVDGNYMGFLGE